MLAHRRGVWSWRVGMGPRVGLSVGSQEREQNPSSTVRISLSTPRAPPPSETSLPSKLNVRKIWTVFEPVEKKSPLRMRKRQCHSWGWSRQRLKGYLSAGPPLTIFMEEGEGFYWGHLWVFMGCGLFYCPSRGTREAREIHTHTSNRRLIPGGFLRSLASLPDKTGWLVKFAWLLDYCYND